MPAIASPRSSPAPASARAATPSCGSRTAGSSVNGKVIRTPAFNITEKDKVKVDGQPLADRQGTRVWLYHKPAGLVVTEKDPEGRATIFETLEAQGLPRVVSIGRLDINTEGLLLLTNDGGLKRVLELPATGWLRRYRVRAFGTVTQQQLNAAGRRASRSTASNTARSKRRSSASRAAMSGWCCSCAKARTARSRTSSPRSASRSTG